MMAQAPQILRPAALADADPIRTEVVRQALNSAAAQMSRALVRTAFTPLIYEVLDYAAAIYDADVRLLAQAPTLPLFMGTLNFCIDAAVEAVGGTDKLEPGDIILYNWPYGTGSHAQDGALVLPVFLADGTLAGYCAIKAHWVDIGAKDFYCTDTTDVHQEGTFYPGIKLYRRGELNDDVMRIMLANSRAPKLVAGDINAEVGALRIGAAALVRVVERFGHEVFSACVERMYDHGEAIVRNVIAGLPDGRYLGHGVLDDDGLSDDPIPFEVVLEIDGTTARVDFRNAPDAQRGPVNCPLASTVSAARVAISMLAGAGEAPNEGHFRPVEVLTRPGSMFHALPPSPCFLYGWPAMQAIEAIYQALAEAMPAGVTACSGGDICGFIWYGVDPASGDVWADGGPHPVGQGAHAAGDGASSLIHIAEASTHFTPCEVREAKFPWLIERMELAVDSCGPGRHRGGLGFELHVRALADATMIAVIERSKTPPWGLLGGGEAVANVAYLRSPDGERTRVTKITGMPVPAGSVFELHAGGGGGYGPAAERTVEAVQADLREGYVTEAHARLHYPHAFA